MLPLCANPAPPMQNAIERPMIAFDLAALDPSDFDMIDGGARVGYTGDCARL